MRVLFFLCLLLSDQVKAESEFLPFLEGPGEITKNIFQQRKIAMEEIIEGFVVSYDDNTFLFEPADRPGDSVNKASCYNNSRFPAEFSAKYEEGVKDGQNFNKLTFLCDTETPWVITFERENGKLPLTAMGFLNLSWTEKLGELKSFSVSMEWVSSGVFRIFRQPEKGADVFSITANYENEDFHYRIIDEKIYYISYNNNVVEFFEAIETPIQNSFPDIFIYNHRDGREMGKKELRQRYQGWFSGVFVFFVNQALF